MAENTTAAKTTETGTAWYSYLTAPLELLATPFKLAFGLVNNIIGQFSSLINPNDIGKTFTDLKNKFTEGADLVKEIRAEIKSAKEALKDKKDSKISATELKREISEAINSADGFWVNDDPSLPTLQAIGKELKNTKTLTSDQVADVFEKLMEAKSKTLFPSTGTAVDEALKASRDMMKREAVLFNKNK